MNKRYTIKKKRDGQDYKIIGEFYEKSWSEAKDTFTEYIREMMSVEHGVIYVDEDILRSTSEEVQEQYKSPGYYDEEGVFSSLPLLDDTVIDTFQYDNKTWTIKNV